MEAGAFWIFVQTRRGDDNGVLIGCVNEEESVAAPMAAASNLTRGIVICTFHIKRKNSIGITLRTVCICLVRTLCDGEESGIVQKNV
jgi:hypothetical protein